MDVLQHLKRQQMSSKFTTNTLRDGIKRDTYSSSDRYQKEFKIPKKDIEKFINEKNK
jgi:hypothetical protein